MATTSFEFQELTPRTDVGRCVEGIMLYGTAELETSDPNWPDQFYVASVTFDGGHPVSLAVANAHPNSFSGKLFKIVADELENSKTTLGDLAQRAFCEAVEDQMEAA